MREKRKGSGRHLGRGLGTLQRQAQGLGEQALLVTRRAHGEEALEQRPLAPAVAPGFAPGVAAVAGVLDVRG
jgi:hypothetical protein